jgi:hypothetical protein
MKTTTIPSAREVKIDRIIREAFACEYAANEMHDMARAIGDCDRFSPLEYADIINNAIRRAARTVDVALREGEVNQ